MRAMTKTRRAARSNGAQIDTAPPRIPGQVVLVLQGGGALGAYQVGVYEALHEAGIAPQWVIGTSIGAINAALIAGSKPDDRVAKLCDFWSRVQNDHFVPGGLPAWLPTATRNALAVSTGVP